MQDTKIEQVSLVPRKPNYIIMTGLLSLCWAWTLSASTLFMFVCTISAKSICIDEQCNHMKDSEATMTFGTYLIGAALSSIPSDYIFRSLGRRKGFLLGCILQVIGSVMGAIAMFYNSVPLLFLGAVFVGLGQGFGQFYRFAAVETAPPEKKSWAVTFVLSGGVLAAILGPSLAVPGKFWLTKNFLGCYIIMALLGVVNFFTILFVEFDESKLGNNKRKIGGGSAPDDVTLWDVVSQNIYILSVAIATVAQTIMIMLMSNCAIVMQNLGFSTFDTSLVFNLHFLCMYGPAFFTGKLIGAYGTFAVAFSGALVYAFSQLIAVFSSELWAFYVSMPFLGLAWNFSFTAGTVMLTNCYPPEFTTACQGINDFFVFGISGIFSIVSGLIVESYGWNVQIFICFGLLAAFVLMFFIAYNANLKGKDNAEAELEKMVLVQTARNTIAKFEFESNQIDVASSTSYITTSTATRSSINNTFFDTGMGETPSRSSQSGSLASRPSHLGIRPSIDSIRMTVQIRNSSLNNRGGGGDGFRAIQPTLLAGGFARNVKRVFTSEGMDSTIVDSLKFQSGANTDEDDSVIRASMGGF